MTSSTRGGCTRRFSIMVGGSKTEARSKDMEHVKISEYFRVFFITAFDIFSFDLSNAVCFFFSPQYFQITSSVYENLIMCVDVEALESAEDTLEELQSSLINIGKYCHAFRWVSLDLIYCSYDVITVHLSIVDALEKELVREGEKLSDLLSIPVKDALGRELAVNYHEDIVNVREILEMTIARRQLFKDSVELQKLTLQQVIHIHSYEKNAKQVTTAK